MSLLGFRTQRYCISFLHSLIRDLNDLRIEIRYANSIAAFKYNLNRLSNSISPHRSIQLEIVLASLVIP